MSDYLTTQIITYMGNKRKLLSKIVLGKVFFDETLSWQVMIGLLFIVIGVAIVNSFSASNMPEQ